MRLSVIPLLVATVLTSSAGLAANVTVDTIPALQSAIYHAAPGDVITVKDGVYPTTKPITVKCAGTADLPVTITAETVGGVELTGTNGFSISEPAAYVTIAGFNFTHASGKNAIGAGTGNIRFTRNTFRCTGNGAYLSVTGDDARIDYNEFAEKKTSGSMIAVAGTGSQVARRLWIHHNHLHGFSLSAGGHAEVIRYGLGAFSQSTGAGLVEHNLFEDCTGQIELILNSSSGNTYRYNTFLNSPNSQLTLRHGNDCIVYGNILRNTAGLRIFGDRHQVYSNYFEGNYMGVNLGNGGAEASDGGAISGHDRPEHCVIVFNTFVDNRTHYQMSRRAIGALGANNITFSDNLLIGGSVAAKIEGPYEGAVWADNVLWNVPNPGDLPAGAYAKADPGLTEGPDRLKRPSPDNPALQAAPGSFPLVIFDLDGQPRSDPKTVGADQISTAPVVARSLSPADVGPHAGDTPVPATPSPEPPPPPEDNSTAPPATAAPPTLLAPPPTSTGETAPTEQPESDQSPPATPETAPAGQGAP